jgi:light-regulated signal transduction histidine kinase (bacteriophytochrome)
MSGISKEEVTGKKLTDVFPAILRDEEMLTAITNALEGKKSFLPANYSSFNRTHYENHFIPLKNGSGEVIGVMNLMHDVSHRIKAERELYRLNVELQKKYKQLEKANNELAAFTYFTGRDIKEPLKQVYTSIEMLIRKEAATMTNLSRGNLRKTQGSLNKINLMLDDILTVSATTTHNTSPEMVELDDVLAVAKSKLKRKIEESGARITSERLPSIPGYPHMLETLFIHLIDNAIKFQPDNKVPVLTVGSERSGRYFRLSFRDNGIGFEQNDTQKIFELFGKLHNHKYHGSGIGLTVCKKICEAHDGYIQATSKPGEGTVIDCFFPAENQIGNIKTSDNPLPAR